MNGLFLSLTNYFKNFTFDIYAGINIFVVLVAMMMMFSFFFKRRSGKIAVLYFLYIVLLVLVHVASETVGGDALLITCTILDVFGLVLIVVFGAVYQSELKALFVRFGRGAKHEVYRGYVSSNEELVEAANEIVKASQNMAKNDIGAIIIIAPTSVPEHIVNSGTKMDALLSASLLESIFNKKSPLHDGAVIISGNRIVAAGCFLPLSQSNAISKDLGTRHRAAIGITEETDVLTIVVSEETGIISTAEHAEIRRYVTAEKLQDTIEKAYGVQYVSTKELKKHRWRR